MMNSVLNLTFASSLSGLCEVNSSFDSGILRIAYPGQNRNGSSISKAAFEKCIHTIYNCPIVTNYDRDTNTLGGHDMEVVRDNDGNIKVVNLTTPVGVIPESAKWFWSEAEDDDGEIREYLCVEALLWKRQEAYQKIKNDGVTEQSMEISVKSGELINGIYHIYDFEFTAFALIGCTPCFQGAALEVFSKVDFKQQLTDMMRELKDYYCKIEALTKVCDKDLFSVEGGKVLDEKINLAKEYGVDIDSLDFSIEEYSLEELKAKFEEMSTPTQNEPAQDDVVVVDSGVDTDNEPKSDNFELNGNITESIMRALDEFKIQRDWGETYRYCFVDFDLENCEVYCWDTEDWLLYGFTYENNGDNVVIDIDSKKRKKFAIVNFDEGEQPSPIAGVFTQMNDIISGYAEREIEYKAESEKFANMETELNALRQFKTETEENIAQKERDELFSRFSDLFGDESFEALKENCKKYDLETLEDKCFAIRGRKSSVAKFTLENVVKTKIDKRESDLRDEPYGDLFVKYNVGQTK